MPFQLITYPPDLKQPQRLFVLLHGWGANYQDLVPLAPYLQLSQCQFLFPNAPFAHPQVPGGQMWYDLAIDPMTMMPTIPWHLDGGTDADNDYLTKSRSHLTDWLRSLESTTGIPLSQTLLAGFSQGGAMALDVGLDLPLAGVISCSGYWHRSTAPSATPPGTTVPPVLLVHGEFDPVVPVNAARSARDRLQHVGVSVDYAEYPMGHEIALPALERMQQFAVEKLGS